MWSREAILEYLRSNLKPQRYEHSLRVEKTSIDLAGLYNINSEKAGIAGLIHDCAKNMKSSDMFRLIKENGYTIDELFKENNNILHGLCSAIIGKTVMNIDDEEIFNAAAYHTTGKAHMTTLEKIIYLADYIEPMRNFPGVEELRIIAYKNLDEALLMSFNNTIKYVIEKGELIHKDTVEGRNYLLYFRK